MPLESGRRHPRIPPRNWMKSCRQSEPPRSAAGASRLRTNEVPRQSQRNARTSSLQSADDAGRAGRPADTIQAFKRGEGLIKKEEREEHNRKMRQKSRPDLVETLNTPDR